MAVVTRPEGHAAVDVGRRRKVEVIDCDVHPAPRSLSEILGYMPPQWRAKYPAQFGGAYTMKGAAPGDAKRGDSWPAMGGPPCSDPDFAAKQLLDEAGVDLAILVPQTASPLPNPDHEAAMCAATNEWLAATWLSKYNSSNNYVGSIRISTMAPEAAVEEIEKWGDHPHFVQVETTPHSMSPLGQRQFHPIYEAACRHNLPFALHTIRSSGMWQGLTPVGHSSYWSENHTTRFLCFAADLASFVFEGVFDKFPSFRLALLECGFSWVGPLMWRLDNYWEAFRSEVPWVQRRPSEYVRERVRFTTQPMEEPPQRKDLVRAYDVSDAEHMLMFSTDYPHFDFDDPEYVRSRIPAAMRQRIFRDNALTFYGAKLLTLVEGREG